MVLAPMSCHGSRLPWLLEEVMLSAPGQMLGPQWQLVLEDLRWVLQLPITLRSCPEITGGGVLSVSSLELEEELWQLLPQHLKYAHFEL
jgi:hypothetical protein